jgi:hypothetical protein
LAAPEIGAVTVKIREVYKFLCGFLSGAGVVHANMGFAIAAGMISEPHYLGRTWSAASLWIGAGAYLLASLVVGYLGWGRSAAAHSAASRLRESDSSQQRVMR